MTIIETWMAFVRAFILPSLAMCGGTHHEEDILAGLYAGKFMLWVSGDQNGGAGV